MPPYPGLVLEDQGEAQWRRLSETAGDGSTIPAKSYRLLHAICATAVNDELIGRNPCTIRGAGQEATHRRPMFTLH